MRLTRLQLTGFKSFGEPVLLPIEAGITAIVGPNGSGKSNIVEALRWVMGESSPRRLRGDQSQDLIFSGTAVVSARQIAAVDLDITAASHHLPPPLDREETLRVSRRVERGGSSAWTINGSPVRGRDVRLLFADAASGARSHAIIGQGEVADVVTASSQSRRLLLEEAAGVTGLAARRKEALTKLRAADTNMLRVGDLLTQIDSQLDILKKQERQARRYRSLSEKIERWETLLWLSRHRRAREELDTAREQCRKARSDREDGEKKVENLRRRRGAVRQSVEKALEQRDASIVENRRHEEELADIDRRRRTGEEEKQRLEKRLLDIQADLDSVSRMAEATETNIARLLDEMGRIEKAEPVEESAAERRGREALERRVEDLGKALAQERDTIARLRAERESIERERARIIARESEYAEILTDLAGQISRARKRLAPASASEDETVDLDALEAALGKSEQDHTQAGEAEAAAKAAWIEASRKREAQERRRAVLEDRIRKGRSLIDSLSLDKAWKPALMAALGDDLSAPLHAEPAADDGGWHPRGSKEPSPPWPDSVTPLHRHVRGPAFLKARLERIGVVDSPARGAALQSSLRPGQRLVDRQGRMWRWDGYSCRVTLDRSIPTLQEETALLEKLRREEDARHRVLRQAEAARVTAHARQEKDRAALIRATRRLEKRAGQEEDRARHRLEIERLEGRKQEAERHRRQARERRLESDRRLRSLVLPKPDRKREREWEKQSRELARLRERRATARARIEERAERLDRLKLSAERLGDEQREMDERRQRRRKDHEEAHLALEECKGLPARLEGEEKRARARVEASRRQRRDDDRALGQQRETLADIEERLEESEAQSALHREEDARWREKSAFLEEKILSLEKDILRTLSRPVEELEAALAEEKGSEAFDPSPLDESTLEDDIRAARRRREAIGPVNLQACERMEAEEDRRQQLAAEIEDLERAKRSLEKAIHDLERRSKEKLIRSFAILQKEFSTLFRRFFPGGRCRLSMTDGEDPLDFGLDVFVTLPGKKPRPLTLLSGGEQSLTGLALVLASFLANPSPLLVLDEVDAALDESNLDILCSVLQDILRRHRVPVMIVTHNILTMSRAERLYGVTMSTAGISRLAAVDLDHAARLRQAS